MVNPELPDADYEHYLDYTRARALVADIALDQSHSAAHRAHRKLLRGVTQRWRRRQLERDRRTRIAVSSTNFDTSKDDPSVWLFTSGSTGKPKAAVHLHHDFPFNTECYAKQVLQMRARRRHARRAQALLRLRDRHQPDVPVRRRCHHGAVPERATPERLFELIARHRPTVLTTVPTMINKMVQAAGAPRSLAPLRVCISAGEALPPELYHRWKETLRRRDPRRHRLGRAVPHLHLQPLRRGAPRLARPAGPRLRGAAWSAPTATTSPTARSARCGSRATRRRSATGRRTRSPRRCCAATGSSPAICSVATPTASSPTPAAPTTCSRSAASSSRRWRSSRACCAIRRVLEAAVVGYEDDDGLVKPLAYVVAKGAAPSEALARDDHRALQARAGALQGAAPDRVRRRAAAQRSRQDPAARAALVRRLARADLARGGRAASRARPDRARAHRLDRGARSAPAARHRRDLVRGAGARAPPPRSTATAT